MLREADDATVGSVRGQRWGESARRGLPGKTNWDKLLEQRILLQKMLTKVNRFPIDVDSFVYCLISVTGNQSFPKKSAGTYESLVSI